VCIANFGDTKTVAAFFFFLPAFDVNGLVGGNGGGSLTPGWAAGFFCAVPAVRACYNEN